MSVSAAARRPVSLGPRPSSTRTASAHAPVHASNCPMRSRVSGVASLGAHDGVSSIQRLRNCCARHQPSRRLVAARLPPHARLRHRGHARDEGLVRRATAPAHRGPARRTATGAHRARCRGSPVAELALACHDEQRLDVLGRSAAGGHQFAPVLRVPARSARRLSRGRSRGGAIAFAAGPSSSGCSSSRARSGLPLLRQRAATAARMSSQPGVPGHAPRAPASPTSSGAAAAVTRSLPAAQSAVCVHGRRSGSTATRSPRRRADPRPPAPARTARGRRRWPRRGRRCGRSRRPPHRAAPRLIALSPWRRHHTGLEGSTSSPSRASDSTVASSPAAAATPMSRSRTDVARGSSRRTSSPSAMPRTGSASTSTQNASFRIALSAGRNWRASRNASAASRVRPASRSVRARPTRASTSSLPSVVLRRRRCRACSRRGGTAPAHAAMHQAGRPAEATRRRHDCLPAGDVCPSSCW